MGQCRGVEDGAVHLGGHHGPRVALSAGCHFAALSGQHCQLEGVQLHTGTHTHSHSHTHNRVSDVLKNKFLSLLDKRQTGRTPSDD